MENELLYGIEHEVDEKVLDVDFTISIGKSKIEKEGRTGFTLVGFGKGFHKAIEGVGDLEKDYRIKAEVINQEGGE